MDIALTTTATLSDQQALSVFGQVADLFVGLDAGYHGTDRNANGRVAAGLARHLAAHAVIATLGAKHALVAEVDQGVESFVGNQPDASARSAVAPIRAPNGMNFSRRKLTQPLPPLPA